MSVVRFLIMALHNLYDYGEVSSIVLFQTVGCCDPVYLLHNTKKVGRKRK